MRCTFKHLHLLVGVLLAYGAANRFEILGVIYSNGAAQVEKGLRQGLEDHLAAFDDKGHALTFLNRQQLANGFGKGELSTPANLGSNHGYWLLDSILAVRILFGRIETVSFREKVKRLGDRTQKMVCYSRLRRRHYGYLEKTTLSLKRIVSMKRNAAHLVFALLIIALGGCAAPRLSTVAVDRAEPQQGWEGVNNLFQDNLFYFGRATR